MVVLQIFEVLGPFFVVVAKLKNVELATKFLNIESVAPAVLTSVVKSLLTSPVGGAGLGGSATAVDLGQFRNTEVGIGYQAAGVLRQRTAASAGQRTIELRDTTAAASGTGKRKRLQDGTREHYASDQEVFSPEKSSSRHRRGGNKSVTKPKKDIEMYIRSKGLREFRLELEKILSS